jgi:hypothetical protein
MDSNQTLRERRGRAALRASLITGGGKGPPYTNRKDLPAPPTGWKEYDEVLYPAHFGYVDDRRTLGEQLQKIDAAIAAADRDYATEASAEIRAGKPAPKDPRIALTKRREKVQAEYDVLTQVVRDSAAGIDAWADANREHCDGVDRQFRSDLYEITQHAYASLTDAVDRLHAIDCQTAWRHGSKRPNAKPIASAELNRIGAELDRYMHPVKILDVDPRGMAALQHGKAAVALDGTELPAGTPPSAVRLIHSPDGWRESPLGKAGDRA